MIQRATTPPSGPLTVVTLNDDPGDRTAIQGALEGIGRWSPQWEEAESLQALLSQAARGAIDLCVVNDHASRGECARLVQRVRTAGYDGPLLALVDETSEPRTLIRAGADATLDRESLEPVFVESIIAVALARPHLRQNGR